jgi:hypothetical protein
MAATPGRRKRPASRKMVAAREPAASRPVEQQTGPVPVVQPPVLIVSERRRHSLVPYIATLIIVVAGITLAVRHTSAKPAATAAATTRPANNFAAEGFSVYFPKPPQRGTQTFEFGGVRLTSHVYVYGESGHSLLIQVVSPIPAEAMRDPNYILDSIARGTALGAGGATVTRLTHFNIGGDPAIDVVAGGARVALRSRAIVHGGRIYQVAGFGSNGPPVGYDEFLASFRFTDAAA